MKKRLFNLALLFVTGISFAQVGIGTTTPDNSAALEIKSQTKGFLIPRMTNTERDAIDSPVIGLQVYSTTDNCIQIYNGTWNYLGKDNLGNHTATQNIYLNNNSLMKVDYIEFNRKGGDGVREGYIGFNDTNMHYRAEQGSHLFSGGNVGINVSNATKTLEVGGDVSIYNDLYLPNIDTKYSGNYKFLMVNEATGKVQSLGILDLAKYINLVKCDVSFGGSGDLNAGESVVITDFGGATEGEIYFKVYLYTTCYGKTAMMQGFADLTSDTIKVIVYHHYASTNNDPVIGDGSAEVTSTNSSFGTIKISLVNDSLVFTHVSSACGTATAKVTSGCYNDGL